MNLFISKQDTELDFFEDHINSTTGNGNLRPTLFPEYLPDDFGSAFHTSEYRKELCHLLGLKENAIKSNWKISFINAGCNTVLIPLKDMEAIVQVSASSQLIESYCMEHHIDCLVLFTEDFDYTLRTFSQSRLSEEPTSEYAVAALGYYLNNQAVNWSNLKFDNFTQEGDCETIRLVQEGGRVMYSV